MGQHGYTIVTSEHHLKYISETFEFVRVSPHFTNVTLYGELFNKGVNLITCVSLSHYIGLCLETNNELKHLP